ncbi:hypothetical protein [Nonomuraea sp. CA-141351]|uniref:hypothetical protein n=1 Tax=Nonomuraea sp. CA-141351 TaxID=3239996 RepID=UPI003D8A0361
MIIRGIAGVIALAALGGGTSPAAVGAQLRISGTVTPQPMVIGAESVYMVTVENAGRSDAKNVTIINNLDPNTTPGLLSDDCALVNRGATVVCGGAGLAIPPGSSVTYEIPVTIDPALPDGTRVTNRVEVSATGTDDRSTRMINPARARVKGGPPAAPDTGGSDECATVQNGGNDRPCASAGPGPAQPPNPGPATPPATDPATTAPTKPAPSTGSPAGAGAGPGAGQPPAPGESQAPVLHVIPGGGIIKGGPTGGPHRGRHGAGHGPYEQSGAEAGPGQRRPRPTSGEAETRGDDGAVLPLTGVWVWLVGLGVPMLAAIGLLVWHFSRPDRPGGTDRPGRPGRPDLPGKAS